MKAKLIVMGMLLCVFFAMASCGSRNSSNEPVEDEEPETEVLF